MSLDPAVLWVLRLALAALWLRAGWHKGRDPRAFRAALAEYRLLPAPLVPAAAALLGLAELALALALLVPAGAAAAAQASAALLLLYAAAMAINLARGRRDLDCGCTGPAAARPLGGELLARNALLAAVSLLAALPATERPLGWLDAPTLALGAATLVVLYAAAETALAQAPASRARREGGAWSTR